MSNAGKKHMGRIAQLPCIVCGAYPVQVHHIREGQGMAERASDFLTIPLCPSCHVGPKGIHGDQSLWRIKKMDELDALAKTIEQLMY